MAAFAYLDASAIVKLVAEERESAALRRALRSLPRRLSSALALTEVLRATLRRDPALLGRAQQVLAGLTLLPIDDAALSAAGALEPPELRSLDAIHLATALSLGVDLDRVLTYDERLRDAGRQAGVPVHSPA